MSASGRSNSWVRRWGSKLWWWKNWTVRWGMITMAEDRSLIWASGGWRDHVKLNQKVCWELMSKQGVWFRGDGASIMISKACFQCWCGLNHDLVTCCCGSQPRFWEWAHAGEFSLPCVWGIAMMQTEKVSESVKLPTLNMLSVYCNLSVRGRYYM